MLKMLPVYFPKQNKIKCYIMMLYMFFQYLATNIYYHQIFYIRAKTKIKFHKRQNIINYKKWCFHRVLFTKNLYWSTHMPTNRIRTLLLLHKSKRKAVWYESKARNKISPSWIPGLKAIECLSHTKLETMIINIRLYRALFWLSGYKIQGQIRFYPGRYKVLIRLFVVDPFQC